MKEFFRSLAGSLVALILFAGLGLVLFFVLMVSVASVGSQVPTVPKKAVLIFDLSTNIPDSAQDPDASQAIQKAIQGGQEEGTPLLTLIKSLARATTAKDIVRSIPTKRAAGDVLRVLSTTDPSLTFTEVCAVPAGCTAAP